MNWLTTSAEPRTSSSERSKRPSSAAKILRRATFPASDIAAAALSYTHLSISWGDKRVFLELLAQFPQMAVAIMRELAARLDRTNAQLARTSRA